MQQTEILATVGILIGYFFIYLITRKLIIGLGAKKNVPRERIIYVIKYFHALLLLGAGVVISTIWSVDYKGVLVLTSSIFAVIGVALFAQWSILSNITASMIIFFTFPARIGYKIKVMDGDDTISGEIIEINLFQILLKNDEGEIISYPNNLLLQKPVVMLNK